MHRHLLFLPLILLLLTPLPSLAAEGKEAARQEPQTFLSMIEKSGVSGMIFFSILGVLSLATLATVLERFSSLSRRKVLPPPFVTELRQMVRQGTDRPGQLRELCERFPSTTATILKAGLARAGRPGPEVEKAMEDALGREAGTLRGRVRPLSVAANVAPLIGLLGTVVGIILAFNTASKAPQTSGRGEAMAEGVSLALMATAGGLVIAIPALLFAAFFNHRIDHLLREADECLTETLPGFTRTVPPPVEQSAPREERVEREEREPVEASATPYRVP
jgi:biopolymer transport protein ExbB